MPTTAGRRSAGVSSSSRSGEPSGAVDQVHEQRAERLAAEQPLAPPRRSEQARERGSLACSPAPRAQRSGAPPSLDEQQLVHGRSIAAGSAVGRSDGRFDVRRSVAILASQASVAQW